MSSLQLNTVEDIDNWVKEITTLGRESQIYEIGSAAAYVQQTVDSNSDPSHLQDLLRLSLEKYFKNRNPARGRRTLEYLRELELAHAFPSPHASRYALGLIPILDDLSNQPTTQQTVLMELRGKATFIASEVGPPFDDTNEQWLQIREILIADRGNYQDKNPSLYYALVATAILAGHEPSLDKFSIKAIIQQDPLNAEILNKLIFQVPGLTFSQREDISRRIRLLNDFCEGESSQQEILPHGSTAYSNDRDYFPTLGDEDVVQHPLDHS